MRKLTTERGFTLIEILTVVGIIGMLFLFFIPQVNSAFLKSKESGIYTDFRVFQQANESYFRETRGLNLQLSSLNQYLDEENEVIANGSIMQTKNNDPWSNPYEVTFDTGKITFSSYGKNEDPTVKVYNLVTYLHNGEIGSCTTGLGSKNIQLTISNLDPNFQCGDNVSTTSSSSNELLSVPTNFIALNVTQTKAELSWGAVSEATSYVLRRDNVVIYTGSATSFSDITLTANNTYTYTVASKNGSDLSAYATLTVKTDNNTPVTITTPTNFMAKDITETSAVLSWSSVTGATEYTLLKDDLVIYTGNSTSYSDMALSSNKTYNYSVIAKNSSASSPPSSLIIKTLGETSLIVKDVGLDFTGASAAAITDNGNLLVWGSNDIGQLGLGSTGNPVLPTVVGNDTNWLQVFPGNKGFFALKENGSLWAWGNNLYSELGQGTTSNQSSPKQIGTDTKWKEILSGNNHTIALKTDGTLWSWGLNNMGQLGSNSSTATLQKTPKQIGTDTNWKKVYANKGRAVFATKTDGTLWSWGSNEFGELGLGDTVTRTSPNQIGTDTNWEKVSYVYSAVAAIKTDGTLWTWGEGKYGKLGHGDTANRLTPTQVGNDNDWSNVYTDGYIMIAIKTDGTLWAWGFGTMYQLGQGNTLNLHVPTKIGTDTNWKGIVIGYDTIIGFKTDGTLWSWGQNASAEAGHGYASIQKTPKQIGNDTDWKSVKFMNKSVLAVKNNNTVWGWGLNLTSQLAKEPINETTVSVPTQIIVK